MRRSFGARVLACMLALSVALASVPMSAFADGTGEQYGPIWNAPLGAYANASEFLYAYMVKEGYAIVDKSGYEIRTWDSMSVTDQIVMSNGTAWTVFTREPYVIRNFLVGNWQLISLVTDAALGDLKAELQATYFELHENDGPFAPGGAVGGQGGGGGGIPDEPGDDEPTVDSAPPAAVDGFSSIVMYPQRCASNYDFNATYTTAFAFKVSNGTSVTTQYYDFNPNSEYGYPLPPNITVKIRESATETINGWLSAGKDVVLLFGSNTGTGDYAEDRYSLYAWPVDTGTYTLNTPTSWENFGITYTGPNVDGKYYGASRSTQIVDNSITINTSGTYSQLTAGIRNFNHAGCWYKFFSSSGGSGGGTGGTVSPVPDPSTIEKPESPASPTNPQTPERDNPTIVIGGTTQTVPEPSPAPDLSTIEQLLRLILTNTNTIIEQMNSFSSQLGSLLADEYNMIYDWFTAVNNWLDQLQAQMTRQLAWDNTFFDWLKAIDTDIQYLQSVCQNGFNDVVSWLQNIFNRMVQGNGGGSKPGIVDPNDTSPVMDWLKKVWADFLADLQIVLPDQVGAVVDFLDQLRQKFPFSIPWDIAAMLALLNHDPVTPVFDIPWGVSSTQVQDVHIDLHSWDGVMETIRPMFLLLFAFGLALLTKDLLSGLEGLV